MCHTDSGDFLIGNSLVSVVSHTDTSKNILCIKNIQKHDVEDTITLWFVMQHSILKSIESFLAEFGGALGLFTGFSFMFFAGDHKYKDKDNTNTKTKKNTITNSLVALLDF